MPARRRRRSPLGPGRAPEARAAAAQHPRARRPSSSRPVAGAATGHHRATAGGRGSVSLPGNLQDPWAIKPPSARSSRSSFWIVDQSQSPWIQPGGRPDLDDDPRLVFFPFAAAVAFFTCSRAAVLSFPIATDCARMGQRRWKWRRMQWRSRGGRSGMRRTVQNTSTPMPYKGPLPSGCLVGPSDPVKSCNSRALDTW